MRLLRKLRDDDRGMILVNVLMFVAIASGLVLLMVDREELALDRSLRTREAARAMAAARGGELSALVALRRDAVDQPDYDAVSEPWGSVTERDAPIDGGTFDLTVSDAESRFNINALRSGEAAPTVIFQQIGRSAGLDEAQIIKAIELVRLVGPVTDLRPLRFAGFDAKTLARLEQLVTALPGETSVNLNAATPDLLSVLFQPTSIADQLIAIRNRQGILTLKDLGDVGTTMPPSTSFRSNTFWVRTRARIGDTVQQEATLIQRRKGADDAIEVVPVERWWNAAIPPDAPRFD